MAKTKMLDLVSQIEGMLKETIHRNSDFLEIREILDSLRKEISDSKTAAE